MEIEKYIAGKDKGLSGIELHGDSTLLCKWPGGFDAGTGDPLPPIERGYQPADIAAMKVAAVEAVTAAEDALTKAKERVAMHDALLADAAVFQKRIEANLKAAKERAEADALAEAKANSAEAIEAEK